MNRRTFLGTVGSLAAIEAASVLAAGGGAKRRSTSDTAPRKVIVGTAMQPFWGQYPGLRDRLDQLAGIVDQMAGQAKTKYGRGLDLAVLPETAITGEAEGDALARSVPYTGQVQDVFARKAQEHGCYIVVYEDEDFGIFWSNDPKTTIGEMARSIGVLELEDEMAHVKEFYRKAKARK